MYCWEHSIAIGEGYVTSIRLAEANGDEVVLVLNHLGIGGLFLQCDNTTAFATLLLRV